MEIKNDHTDKYMQRMMETFKNPEHKKDTEEYLLIRSRIDKVNKYTMRNDIQSLLALDKHTEKSFKNLSQDDLIEFESYLEKDHVSKRRSNKIKKEKGLEKSTIEQYMCHIKRFYKYYLNKTEYKKGKQFQKNIQYPDNVAWISVSNDNHRGLPIEKILKEEELLRLLNVCNNIRDQAMFGAGFYDAGLRISELISLNIKNVDFDELGAKIILPKKGMDLKTGERVIRLFLMPSSAKYLKEHCDKHPLKNYDDAPLFLSYDSRNYVKTIGEINKGKATEEDFNKIRLTRPGIEYILQRYCKMADIPRLTPHVLRHNSCTKCAKAGFNEMELRIRYGWSPTSKMPSRYTHLASKDLDDKIKVITGYKEPKDIEPSKLINIVCQNCTEENVPTAKFCSRCGLKLNIKKEDLGVDATTTGIATQEMLQDPGFREFYNDMLALTWEKYKEMKDKKSS